jgi:hypothetical protein
MRLLGPGLAALLFAACAGPRGSGAALEPAVPVRRGPPEVKDPNFILVVGESVPNPDDDGVSFTKVFVDGKEAGQIPVGRKSEERTLKLKLPLGNEPVRLEQWNLPPVGEWTRLDDSLQPRERFVRIEEGSVARVELRFSEGEGSNTLTVTREAPAAPAPATPPAP